MKTGPKAPSRYTQEFIENEATQLLIYAEQAQIPFLCHFCTGREYSSQRISEFARANEKFSEALNKFKDWQQTKIINMGFMSKNPTMSIFALKNVSAWRDSPEKEEDDDGTKDRDLIIPGLPNKAEGLNRFERYLS